MQHGPSQCLPPVHLRGSALERGTCQSHAGTVCGPVFARRHRERAGHCECGFPQGGMLSFQVLRWGLTCPRRAGRPRWSAQMRKTPAAQTVVMWKGQRGCFCIFLPAAQNSSGKLKPSVAVTAVTPPPPRPCKGEALTIDQEEESPALLWHLEDRKPGLSLPRSWWTEPISLSCQPGALGFAWRFHLRGCFGGQSCFCDPWEHCPQGLH